MKTINFIKQIKKDIDKLNLEINGELLDCYHPKVKLAKYLNENIRLLNIIEPFYKKHKIENIRDYYLGQKLYIWLENPCCVFTKVNVSKCCCYLYFGKEFEDVNLYYSLTDRLIVNKNKITVKIPDFSNVKMTDACRSSIKKQIINFFENEERDIKIELHKKSYVPNWLDTYLIFS